MHPALLSIRSLALGVSSTVVLAGCGSTAVGLRSQGASTLADSDLLYTILSAAPPEVTRVLDEREEYRLQILYTQIDRDADNHPTFHSHGIGLEDERYFYPASTVKLPVTALALEKLNDLGIDGLDRSKTMLTGAAAEGQIEANEDPSAASGLPSVGHYVKKILLVSDNDSYNRLYEFLGQAAIREALESKGLDETRIVRRLSIALSPEQNRATNPVRFVDGERVLYEQPLVVNRERWSLDLPDVRQGEGHYSAGELVREPIDFSHSNYFPLEEQQHVLRTLLFPESIPAAERFRLRESDAEFLLRHLSMLPRESTDPVYEDRETYHDSYAKYFLFGDRRDPIPESIRIFNKVGQAYGYLLDNAYVVDFEHGVEFLLTAVLQVNENQIYNDDTYEYDAIGYPFLAALGRSIYDYERSRPRPYPPDLKRFDVH